MNFDEWFKNLSDTPGGVFWGTDISAVRCNMETGWNAGYKEGEAHQFELAEFYKSIKESVAKYQFEEPPKPAAPPCAYPGCKNPVVCGEGFDGKHWCMTHIACAIPTVDYLNKYYDDFLACHTAPRGPITFEKEAKMCAGEECKTCELFKDEKFVLNGGRGCAAPVFEGIERCPWPSKRVEKRTRMQKFFDAVAHMPILRDPEGRVKTHLESCLRAAGYEPQEGV